MPSQPRRSYQGKLGEVLLFSCHWGYSKLLLYSDTPFYKSCEFVNLFGVGQRGLHDAAAAADFIIVYFFIHELYPS